MKLDFLFLLELAKHGLLVGKDSVGQINSFSVAHGLKPDEQLSEAMLCAFFRDNGDAELDAFLNAKIAETIFKETQGKLTIANVREWKKKIRDARRNAGNA